jgi:hypothetical protein
LKRRNVRKKTENRKKKMENRERREKLTAELAEEPQRKRRVVKQNAEIAGKRRAERNKEGDLLSQTEGEHPRER